MLALAFADDRRSAHPGRHRDGDATACSSRSCGPGYAAIPVRPRSTARGSAVDSSASVCACHQVPGRSVGRRSCGAWSGDSSGRCRCSSRSRRRSGCSPAWRSSSVDTRPTDRTGISGAWVCTPRSGVAVSPRRWPGSSSTRPTPTAWAATSRRTATGPRPCTVGWASRCETDGRSPRRAGGPHDVARAHVGRSGLGAAFAASVDEGFGMRPDVPLESASWEGRVGLSCGSSAEDPVHRHRALLSTLVTHDPRRGVAQR